MEPSSEKKNNDTTDDFSDLESFYNEEWQEEVEKMADGGDEEEKDVEGGDDEGGQEEVDGVKEKLNIMYSQQDLRGVNLKIIEDGVKAVDNTKALSFSGGAVQSKGYGKALSPKSNSGSSSWVKDTVSSNMGKAHQPIIEGCREEICALHGDNFVVSLEAGETHRKERKYLSVGIPKKSKLWSKPHKVVHDLAEITGTSMGEAAVLDDGGGLNLASSSSLFSAGTVLCDGSITSSDIRMCNNKFCVLQSKAVARRVWETSKKLGVEGSRPEEEYIDIISEGEKRDEAARKKGISVIGVR